VMNKQREIVYGLRRDILEGESQEERILEWTGEVAEGIVERFAPRDAHVDDWDLAGLNEALYRQFDLRLAGERTEGAVEAGSVEALDAAVQETVEAVYRERERQVGPELLHRLERWILLGLRWEDGEFRGIDQLWKDHLLNMDHLKEGIGLRGYGQRDPLTEYKKEAFDMFQEMMDHLKEVVLEQLFKVRIGSAELAPAPVAAPAAALQPGWREIHGTNGGAAPSEPRMLAGAKVGRNDPCPCGSGKKYKKCCLLKGV
jgi:preprotein translocase subunit SecA